MAANGTNNDITKKGCWEQLCGKLNGILVLLVENGNLDTYTPSSHYYLTQICVWVAILFEAIVLYMTTDGEYGDGVPYPLDQIVSTPIGIIAAIIIMIPMLPIPFFDGFSLDRVLMNIIGVSAILGFSVYNWYICFSLIEPTTDADGVTDRANGIRGTFMLDDIETQDNSWNVIYICCIGYFVCVVLALIAFVLEGIMWRNQSGKESREANQASYVRELLNPVSRGIGPPRATLLGPHTILITWEEPSFGSKTVRTYRVSQSLDGQSTTTSIVCSDTTEWLAKSKNERLKGLQEAHAAASAKPDDTCNPVRFYLAEDLQAGARYKWKVQPVDEDDSKRRGIFSVSTGWGKLPEVQAEKDQSLKESLIHMVKGYDDAYPPITLAQVNHPKVAGASAILEEEDDFQPRVDMIGWLIIFFAPQIYDQGQYSIEHPTANTWKKRLLMGTRFIIYDMPFKLRFVMVFILLILALETAMVVYYASKLGTGLNNYADSQQEVEAANDAVAAGTGQFCSFSEGRNATADAILICGGLLPVVNCTTATSVLSASGKDILTELAAFATFFDELGIDGTDTSLQCNTSTDLGGADFTAIMLLDPQGFNEWAASCIPLDDPPLLATLLSIEEACDTVSDITVFPSSKDVRSAADYWPPNLALAGFIASGFTMWFGIAFCAGTVQSVHMLREGKKVQGFKHKDLHRIFGPYQQATFIGSTMAFYAGGNLICVVLWWAIGLCLSWDPVVENFTKPLLEYLFWWCISFVFNMVIFKGYMMKTLTCDDSHFFFFKNSSGYFLIDFLLLLYFIPYCSMNLVYKVLYGFLIILALIFRMDMTNYGEGVETYDSGFSATMALISMNERCNNPVIRCFSRIGHSEVFASKFAGAGSDKPRQFQKPKLGDKKGQLARIRWHLAYTLVNNPSVIKYRRGKGSSKHATPTFAFASASKDSSPSPSSTTVPATKSGNSIELKNPVAK